MQGWRVEHETIDRDVNAREAVRRTSSFPSLKWSRDALDRQVLVFGISRTVPASERGELRKCASGTFEVEAGWVATPFGAGGRLVNCGSGRRSDAPLMPVKPWPPRRAGAASSPRGERASTPR
jgi:hypothetical protein